MSGVILSLKDNGYKIIHSRSSLITCDIDCWLLNIDTYTGTMLIVIYDCDGMYVQGNDLLNLLSCPFQSVPTRINTTQLFQHIRAIGWSCWLIYNILSNGSHTNDNNATAPSSSLLVDAVTVAVTLPLVRCVYST